MDPALESIESAIQSARETWLFLDYDGTLAPFAPTPDTIQPDPELIMLLTGLSALPNFRVIVLSGRKRSHIQALLPIPKLLIYGSYGLEGPGTTQSEGIADRMARARMTLDVVKPLLENLLKGRTGFYLEDKGWTLAVHARFADPEEAVEVLKEARRLMEASNISGDFAIQSSRVFLEIGPVGGTKRSTVQQILTDFPLGAVAVYIGDDDKDEDAFSEIKAHGGYAILVSEHTSPTAADARIQSPAQVRAWLQKLLAQHSHG